MPNQPGEIILTGSYAQLIQSMTQIKATQILLNQLGLTGGSQSRPLPNYVKGQIYIKLYFYGKIRGTAHSHRVEKSFRLMKDDPRTISGERIHALAEKVKSKFFKPIFQFSTGREAYTYNDPENGFNRIWGYFNNQTEAMKVYEQMLDIIQVSPKWSRLTKSTVVEPGDRFKEPPEKVLQAGTLIRVDRERPVADMVFKQATIKFPHIRDEIPLVTELGTTLTGLNWLDKYKN
jgi:hypothetical protein